MKRIINEEDILHLDSIIEQDNRYKGMTVKEAICEDRGCVMQMLKKGLYFGDDVLEYANIKKILKHESWSLDYNGVTLYSTDWPEKPEKKKDNKIIISTEGERDESFYLN